MALNVQLRISCCFIQESQVRTCRSQCSRGFAFVTSLLLSLWRSTSYSFVLIACLVSSRRHVSTEATSSRVYLRIYIKKICRASASLMCNCSFYHFKQNTAMQAEDRSQMAMFMDYSPGKFYWLIMDTNLGLAAFCRSQLWTNRCHLWKKKTQK